MSYVLHQTPPPPAYAVDWDAVAAFPWVAAMAGVRQEPEWHAEGDVFAHTWMVAEAMAGLGEWRARAEPDRHVLFAAALLHDVAKPACTRFEDGRWTSPKHAKVGEGVARNLLWTGEAGGVPAFIERERIAKLVRYHGLPLRFADKPDPARALVLASLEVNLRDVALLAMADVLGRECAGKDQLVESVRLFVEYAAELGCLDEPRRFDHEHHRFMYCVGRKPMDYVPYAPAGGDGFEVTLMSGLPGSGKSTVAVRTAGDRPVINLDVIRGRLGVDGGDDQSQVVLAAREEAKTYLRARRPFVWDATNTSRDMRSGLIALFANYGATTRIVYVEAPSWAEMFARNRARERRVPDAVIARLAEKLEVPSAAEAHRVEHVVGTV
jgi:putative nucleotidyltransferase with HDIG domain